MTHKHVLRSLSCILLCFCLLALPALAFIIGTPADLEALHPSPENSDPVPAENATPIATNLSFSTYRNVAITEQLSAFDPEGDLLTFRVTKNPARGAVTIAEDGQFTYTPYENKSGKDSFTYVAEDAKGNVSEPCTVKLKIQKQRSKINYADMGGHPAHKAAIQLAELDVLVGQRIGKTYFFQPDALVSREEFLSLAMQALDSPLIEDAITTGFADDDAIATWAKPYVATALYDGSITGSNNEEGAASFYPTQPISRGEAGVLVDRLLQLSDVAKSTEDVPTWASQSVANLSAVGLMPAGNSLAEPLSKGETALLLSATLDLLDFRTAGHNPLF